jgi:formylglycine-generating enzyme required for sulfatase activity
MRTQTELARRLSDAREETDHLFRLVRPDSLYERPIAERHRIVFYLGHLEAFDWNLIARYALDMPAFHAEFDRLFAFGIDPPPGQLPADRPGDWPGLPEIETYNRTVRDRIDAVMDDVPEQLLHVAVEHRLMHAETFAYILHQLPHERKIAPEPPAAAVSRPVLRRAIDIPAGTARLGLREGDGFGWDNEFEANSVSVPAFAIDRYKVTNRDYLEFVREGAAAPFFWAERNGEWFYRGMFADIALPLDTPVFVTLHEAESYARWRGKSLMTEAQFHRAACSAPRSQAADFRHWDPIPVTADDPAGGGPQQLVGNGWEWTSTPFAPFPGFKPFPFYENYSAPFFDGEHYVLKGGSHRTAGCLLRPSFRNWFRPSYPYIYATFRLAEN